MNEAISLFFAFFASFFLGTMFFYATTNGFVDEPKRLISAMGMGTLLAVVITIMVGSFNVATNHSKTREVGYDDYRHANDLAKLDPRLKDKVAEAMSDNQIDQSEFRSLLDEQRQVFKERQIESIKREISVR